MSTRTESLALAIEAPPVEAAATSSKVYDRSSFEGDFLIVIPGQTADDFERHAPERQFCEYFDGTIYMPSPDSDRHQELTGFFYHLLDGFRCERDTGQVLTGPAVLRLTPERKPEPDVFVRPTPEQAAPGGPFAEAKAVLVIEVLSPSNRGYDLDLKGSFYREAGIPEIWYVDDRDQVLIVDRKVGEGYRTERITEGIVPLAGVPGFWIDVAWLWSDPLPNRRRCLEMILAGPPA